MPLRTGRKLALALALAAVAASAAPALAASATERVSVGPGGAQANAGAAGPAISGDGRFVAFQSSAGNLVAGDTNGANDIFVRDRQAGTTRRVSVGPGGAQADDGSYEADITPDGRFVAFSSYAANLAPGDANDASDVFLRDTSTGETRLVSLRRDGVRGDDDSYEPAVSDDGRFVAFSTEAGSLVPGDTGGRSQVVLRDMRAGTLRLLSAAGGAPAGGSARRPAISGNGFVVAFHAGAADLVPGDTNGVDDILVYDRRTRSLRRASVGRGGAQADGPSSSATLSRDGTRVAFASDATNLVPGDTNGARDVFVRDLAAGTTTRVNLGPGGAQADRDGGSLFDAPSISATGRHVAFASVAKLATRDSNGTWDIHVRDTVEGTTTRVSLGPGGAWGDGLSVDADISADGRHVAFWSAATNLVPGDTNNEADVFISSR